MFAYQDEKRSALAKGWCAQQDVDSEARVGAANTSTGKQDAHRLYTWKG